MRPWHDRLVSSGPTPLRQGDETDAKTRQGLQHLGVGFVSLTEALDLTTPAGRAMAGLLAVFTEFEREILRERVRSGLARARHEGKKLGRPPTAIRHTAEVQRLHDAGLSKAAIARRLQIGSTLVRRILDVAGMIQWSGGSCVPHSNDNSRLFPASLIAKRFGHPDTTSAKGTKSTSPGRRTRTRYPRTQYRSEGSSSQG